MQRSRWVPGHSGFSRSGAASVQFLLFLPFPGSRIKLCTWEGVFAGWTWATRRGEEKGGHVKDRESTDRVVRVWGYKKYWGEGGGGIWKWWGEKRIVEKTFFMDWLYDFAQTLNRSQLQIPSQWKWSYYNVREFPRRFSEVFIKALSKSKPFLQMWRRWSLGERGMLRREKNQDTGGKKGRRIKEYLRICLSVVYFPFYSDRICCGPQVENTHLLFHSLREARKARKLEIQLHFLIISPSSPSQTCPASTSRNCIFP